MNHIEILATSSIPGWDGEIELIQTTFVSVIGYTPVRAMAEAIDQLRTEARRADGNVVLGVGFSHQEIGNVTKVVGWGTIIKATPAPLVVG